MKSEASMPRLVCSALSVYLTFVRCLKQLPIGSGDTLDLFKNMSTLKMEDSALLSKIEKPSVVSLIVTPLLDQPSDEL